MAVQVLTIKKNKNVKKNEFIERVRVLSEQYTSMILFICDNVCSNQLKKIRKLLTEHGQLVMGKNTLFKKGFASSIHNTKYDKILTQLSGNVGVLFTNKNLKEMKTLVEGVTEMAPVKANMVAQCDVVIPKGLTSLPPDKTSFFQALNISTMINKANIQIMSDINLLKKGQKVGASEAALMKMLDIKPFSYMMQTKYIYEDGSAYPPEVLDLTADDIITVFKSTVSEIACVSLAVDYPTRVSVPYMISSALSDLVAICLEADISNEIVDNFKSSMSNAVSAAPVAVVAEQKVEEVKEEEPVVEEEEEGGLADLFGD